ncbi:MAG: hypothetical protein GOV15_02980 [Candidatus Diapherotrites archaeon]|nr:hypothetical protein [Candidatus Diapherotrites archaeon]
MNKTKVQSARNSRALSPVISVILLIIVVVALVIILYGFSAGMIGGTTTAVTESQMGMTSSTATGFIESIDTDDDIIYIRSTNKTGATLDALYIDGKRFDGTKTLQAEGSVALDNSEWENFDVSPNQDVVIAGSNNFRVVGKS